MAAIASGVGYSQEAGGQPEALTQLLLSRLQARLGEGGGTLSTEQRTKQSQLADRKEHSDSLGNKLQKHLPTTTSESVDAEKIAVPKKFEVHEIEDSDSDNDENARRQTPAPAPAKAPIKEPHAKNAKGGSGTDKMAPIVAVQCSDKVIHLPQDRVKLAASVFSDLGRIQSAVLIAALPAIDNSLPVIAVQCSDIVMHLPQDKVELAESVFTDLSKIQSAILLAALPALKKLSK